MSPGWKAEGVRNICSFGGLMLCMNISHTMPFLLFFLLSRREV